jgi:hypothetical protein
MRLLLSILLLASATGRVAAQSVALNDANPAIERWMYPFNVSPCDRVAGSTFGSFGDDTGVDTRHAQQLVGWNTAALITTNRGPANYLIKSCRVTITINRGNLFAYDPIQDDYRTYFDTNHAEYLPDADVGRPMELFGVGFRNGFDAASFDNCSAFGSNAAGERNAYAAGWATNGALVDVGNNVGKTNVAFPSFEVWPFAIGQTTNVTSGELVPAAAKITFDLNLSDPFVVTYLQRALDTGRLRLMLSSLHVTDGQFGQPAYPDFATHFSEVLIDPTRLELDATVVRELDTDTDGLPDDWEQFYFTNLTQTATGDFDGDGANDQSEFIAGTNPTDAASVFRVTTFQHAANQSELRWPNLPSRRFDLDFSTNLTTWQTVTNPALQFLTPTTAVWSETTNAPARFYRVRASLGN